MDIKTLINKLPKGDRYDKGLKYFKQNRVKNALIHDGSLIADVIGSDSYDVNIQLQKKMETRCSCPDSAIYCKHIIAALFFYKNKKDSITNFDKIIEKLKQKDKDELLQIIKQMYLNKTDLVSLLELKKKRSIKKIDDFSKDFYGVEELFGEFIHWNEMPELYRKLRSIYSIALEHNEQKETTMSFAILWSLVRTINRKIDKCDDSRGQVGEFFFECIGTLSPLVNEVITKRKQRESFFEENLKLWQGDDFGLNEGLIDLIGESAKPEDKEFLLKEIEDILKILRKKKNDFTTKYDIEELTELKQVIEKIK